MTDFKEYSELYHHGVKGQRWGVRHEQPKTGFKKKRSVEDKTYKKLPKKVSKKKVDAGKKIARRYLLGALGSTVLSAGVAGALWGLPSAALSAGFTASANAARYGRYRQQLKKQKKK